MRYSSSPLRRLFRSKTFHAVLALVLGFTGEVTSEDLTAAKDQPAHRIVKEQPATEPFVKTPLGYMIPYTARIPGTEITFELVPVPGSKPAPRDDGEDFETVQPFPTIEITMKHSTSTFIAALTILTLNTGWAEDGESLVEPGAEVTKLAGGMKFTEGPVWLPDEEKLIFSDIPNSKLMQWSEADGLSDFRPSEQANGNILDLEGRIISCQHRGRNLVRIEADGTVTVLADKYEGKRFNSPNDVAVRSDGTLWFTDPPWGLTGPHEIPGHWVFKLDPKSGKIEAIIKDLAMPNGIVFSPDETRLYVADTGGNARHPDPKFHKLPAVIRCYDVNSDGQLGEQRFQINEGSDGMAVDVQGNLYTTHGGKVNIFDADGKKLEQIDVPEGPANVCFGDDDFRTLFITARTSLYSVRMKHAGAKSKGGK